MLPEETEIWAIIIDALDGADEVIVGPTVKRSVWIDGGPGNDRIVVQPGTGLWTDKADAQGDNKTRNDTVSARTRRMTWVI